MSKKKPADADETGIGLEEGDGEPVAGEGAGLRIEGRPRQDRRPLCPKHGKQMVAYSTNAMHTFYKCPIDGCAERAKRVRPVGPFKDLYGNGKSRS